MKKANQVLDLPDQRTNYNAVQLSLPMDIAITLDQEDEVFSFLEAVKEVNFSKYVKPVRSNNTRSHSRTMLLKTMLFGYMNGVQSLEELSQLCRTDLRYLYLTQEERPSKMAFSRMTETLAETIDEIFFEISGLIAEELGCDTNVHYIDGTKIEANANKNTLKETARIFGYNPDYLSLRFKIITGVTFTEKITSIRLQQAKNLLLNSEMTVEQIAAETGFHDKGWLIKKFKETYGRTPAAYRSFIIWGF